MLHQHQGEIKHIEHHGQVIDYIEVVPDDIAFANRLTDELLGRSLNELVQQYGFEENSACQRGTSA